MPDGTEPIDPNEIIYRRVFHDYYNPKKNPPYLSPKAFNPIDSNDNDGISVTRAAYSATPQDVGSAGRINKKYYVIEMLAGDLESIGLFVKPNPIGGNIGHAIIPALNAKDRDSVEVQEKLVLLRTLRFRRMAFPWNGFGINPISVCFQSCFNSHKRALSLRHFYLNTARSNPQPLSSSDSIRRVSVM